MEKERNRAAWAVCFGEPAEIDDWMRLVRHVRDNFPGLETEEAMQGHRETVLRFMKKRQALCAKNDDGITGVLLFSRNRNMICCLAVSPENRRKGIGAALMKKALDELDRSRDVTVSTFREEDEKGTAPRALYRKFGFCEGRLTEEFGYPNQVFTLKGDIANKERKSPMHYTALFHLLYPGFFQEGNIRDLPPDHVFTELVMDLRIPMREGPELKCPEKITFGEYHGEIAGLREAVSLVEEEWVPYFNEGGRFFCAFDGKRIAAFCILDDMGRFQGFRIGGPGCVGTLPEYRRRGIGLEMVRLATESLRQEGFDLSWIHYTHLARWYGKLGYQAVLRWNCTGILEEKEPQN